MANLESDIDIIENIKKGGRKRDNQEIKLYGEYKHKFIGLGIKVFYLEKRDVEELYNDTFTKLINAIKENKFEAREEGSLESYTKRIFINKCLDKKRKR